MSGYNVCPEQHDLVLLYTYTTNCRCDLLAEAVQTTKNKHVNNVMIRRRDRTHHICLIANYILYYVLSTIFYNEGFAN